MGLLPEPPFHAPAQLRPIKGPDVTENTVGKSRHPKAATNEPRPGTAVVEHMNWAFQNPIRLEGNVRRHFESVGLNAMLTLWRRKRLILALMVLAMIGALAVLLTSEKRYTSNALVQIDFSRDDQSGSARQGSGFPVDLAALVETEARFVRSRAIARQVAERLAAEGRTKDERGLQAGTVAEERDILLLMRDLTVRNDSRSYLIDIGFTANDPKRAAEIANLFVEVYLKNRSETSFAAARRASEWYAAQIKDTRTALEAAETAASEYRATFSIVETSSEGGALQQQRMREVSSQASAATLVRLNEEARLDRALRAVAGGNIPPDIAALPQIQRLIESREAAQRQVAELAASSGERHPNVERAKSLLEEIESRLREEVRKAVATITEDASNARKVEAELEANAQTAKQALIGNRSREAELRTLQGRADAIRARLKTLGENYVQAQALSDLKPVAAQVMIAAEPIETPSGPRASLILGFAMLGSAALGAGMAFLLERRDTGFRTEDEVPQETDCPCLGLVAARSRADARHEVAERREAVRGIAASLGLTSFQATSKVVLVTSALPGEGKSLLVDSLALCLVEMGRTVLIVDASPRSEPGDSARPALEDMVADTVSRRQFLDRRHVEPLPVLQRRNAIMRNSLPVVAGEHTTSLSIVQRRTGLSESGAVFANAAIGELVKEACSKFDVVLIEAPPVVLVADSLILAQVADIVVQVVRWHETPKAIVAAALKRLRDTSTRVHGIVLTGVRMNEYRTYQAFRGAFSAKKSRKYYAAFD
jgi:succinoglycan biosynthesis transport protein ExoP